MACELKEKISALIDGELATTEAREVERHLIGCTQCQEARADFLSVRSQLNDVAIPFDPVGQREALARIVGKKKGASQPGWRWVFNPAVAGVAAMLIVAVGVALWLYPRAKLVS